MEMDKKIKALNKKSADRKLYCRPLEERLAKPSDLWDWEKLRKRIKKYGTRNSLLIAPMPTASTSQILGNNETIEPYTSNIYIRRTLGTNYVFIHI